MESTGPYRERCQRPGGEAGSCATRLFGAGAAASVAGMIGAASAGTAVGAAPAPSVALEALKPLPPKLKTAVRSSAEGILGQPVHDAKGQTIAYVVDALINPEGRPQAAVIEVALEPTPLEAMPPYKPAAKSMPVARPAVHAATGYP